MALITIEVKDQVIKVHEGEKLKNSRLEWRAAGLDVWVKGSFGKSYDVAANIAMNYALSIHIPAISLRRAK